MVFVMMRYSSLTVLLILATTMNLSAQLSDFNDVDFGKADSVASLYPHHSIQDMRMLSHKLTNPLSTDVEKFRAIFKWACVNIGYDVDLYHQNRKKREKLKGDELKEWEKKFNAKAYRQLAKDHRTVCTGYAYLVSELAYHAGISCQVVNGYGRSLEANIGGQGIVNHSWNAVFLHDKWYLCDPTWSSGSLDASGQGFLKKSDDAYFLSDPEIFIRSHYPLDSSSMILPEKPTLNQFLNGPLVYSAAFQHEIKSLTPETFDVRIARGSNAKFTFSRKSDKALAKVELYVENRRTNDTFTVLLEGDGISIYSFDHLFPKRGKFAVHVVLNGSHAVTWNVEVD